MKEKRKKKRILLVILLLNSVLSALLANGFMGGIDVLIYIKILCGFIFSLTPLLVICLIIADSKN